MTENGPLPAEEPPLTQLERIPTPTDAGSVDGWSIPTARSSELDLWHPGRRSNKLVTISWLSLWQSLLRR